MSGRDSLNKLMAATTLTYYDIQATREYTDIRIEKTLAKIRDTRKKLEELKVRLTRLRAITDEDLVKSREEIHEAKCKISKELKEAGEDGFAELALLGNKKECDEP